MKHSLGTEMDGSNSMNDENKKSRLTAAKDFTIALGLPNKKY
jgi:hypothetical protein